MVLLEHDLFLLELTRLFQKSRSTGTGSVTMTMKKYNGTTKPTPKSNPRKSSKKAKGKDKGQEGKAKAVPTPHAQPSSPPEPSCLIRAKLHTKKISTLVHPKDVTRFQIAFFSLLKGNMDGLKKLKKSKAKATKAS